MRYIKYSIACWIACILLFACKPKNIQFEKVSMYHWKLKPDVDNSAMKQYPFHNVYLHIMDVHWDAAKTEAIPKAILNIKQENAVLDFPIIPVIYIENQVFAKMPADSIVSFAHNVINSKNAFIASFDAGKILELQIDCDWLQSHKEAYFQFLKTLKTIEPQLKLSTTIRLYPYKYPDIMGVPPADYGVLMCYNMEPIQSATTKNSILDPEVLQQYLTQKSYPIPLQPALPIFGWYAWMQDGAYQSLMYLPNDFSENPLLQPIKSNNFRVLRDTVIGDNYLRVGDILRNEFPSVADIQASILLIKKYLPDADELILYYWDNATTIKNYETVFNQIFPRR